MNGYEVSNDFFEIITGTTNKFHPAYMEAAKEVDKGSNKSLGYIKNFITSIEKIANKDKVKDSRISKTKGNIKNFDICDDIKTSIEFLQKHLGKTGTIKSLNDIYNSLEKYQPQYTEGYEKNIRLVVLEYENAVDILVTGLAMLTAECIDVKQSGSTIKIKKVANKTTGVIHKTIDSFAKQVTGTKHKEYLEELIKSKEYAKVSTSIKESTSFMEAGVADTLELIDVMITSVGKIGHYTMNIVRTIKNSLFGVIPLIRTCLYIRYKKKADTILALEQQVEFISQNIERLENRSNIDPAQKETIIKKQKATIEAYKKKAAKLRAELIETEKDTVTAMNNENPELKEVDDDFILENGVSVTDFF